MPKGSPPGPDFDLKELEALSWGEARRSRGLVPNGGRWWTAEDIAFAVAILDEETRSRAFRRAWAAGMSRGAVRLWLSKALHNRLLDHAACVRRMALLDDFELDALPAPDGQSVGLGDSDAATLAGKLRTRLSKEEAREVARRYGGDGLGSSVASHSRAGPSRATRARHWKEACGALQRLAKEEGLNRTEAGVVMLALSARMTGGGSRRKIPRIRETFGLRRALGSIGS